MNEGPIILTADNVGEYVARRVLPNLTLEDASVADIREVTEQTYVNWIFAVRIKHRAGIETVYLRQSRDHVKGKPDMAMDPERIDFEVRILNLLNELIPGTTPGVLFFDRRNNVAVLSDIKRSGRLLVNELLDGKPHRETATNFGEVVATVHARTLGISNERVRGSDADNKDAVAFHLGMRLEPALERFPAQTHQLLDESQHAEQCLVLGDLASKNIFVEGNSVRFLDLERAFVGDPVFDPAFLFAHYLIEVPISAVQRSIDFIEKFQHSYRRTFSAIKPSVDLDQLENRLIRFVGVTLLYRSFGFYLAVNVAEDKPAWEKRAQTLLEDRSSVSLAHALRSLDIS